MATHVPCKKNDSNGYIFYISLVSQANTKVFQANPTYAAGDIKVAVDDGAPANVSAVAIDGDFTKRVKITLSQAQTNGDNLTIICSDAAGDEWCDLSVNIQTSAQTLDEMDAKIDTLQTQVDTTGVALLAGAVDDIWDEVITGAAHNDATSAGRRLRTAGHDETIARDNTCQAGEDASHVKLDTGASGTNNFYDHMWIYLVAGTGVGQVRLLDSYVGGTFVAEVHPDWLTNPDATSDYTIHAIAPTNTHDIEAEGLASINAEMVDVLKTDALAEVAQGVPSATPTFEKALMLMYMALRNQLLTTASELSIYNDAGTKIAKKALSDDGTTYTEDEMISGV